MEIEFYKKEVYGKTLYYIKDQRMADIIRGLTGTITVSIRDLKLLNALGHTVTEVLAPGKVLIEEVDGSTISYGNF